MSISGKAILLIVSAIALSGSSFALTLKSGKFQADNEVFGKTLPQFKISVPEKNTIKLTVGHFIGGESNIASFGHTATYRRFDETTDVYDRVELIDKNGNPVEIDNGTSRIVVVGNDEFWVKYLLRGKVYNRVKFSIQTN